MGASGRSDSFDPCADAAYEAIQEPVAHGESRGRIGRML